MGLQRRACREKKTSMHSKILTVMNATATANNKPKAQTSGTGVLGW